MTAVCAACGAPTTDAASTCPSCGEAQVQISGPHPALLPASRAEGGIPENLAAALAYVTVIPAIILLMAKRFSTKGFVRFHAFQCIAMTVTIVVLGTIFLLLANVASINLLLIPISLIAAIGIALVVLVCMIKAYQLQVFKLPVLGDWAEKFALRG